MDYTPVGERLKQLREEKGLTPQDLSLLADVSVPAIYAIERGATASPTLDTIQRLLRPLGKILCIGDIDGFCT